MMQKAMMSIKPQYADMILSGKKKYEYRKNMSKRSIDVIVIYATAPVKKVVGEVEVVGVVYGNPRLVWHQTKMHSGITHSFFEHYYKGRNKAIAYKLGVAKRYQKPRDICEYSLKSAPQSYAYL